MVFQVIHIAHGSFVELYDLHLVLLEFSDCDVQILTQLEHFAFANLVVVPFKPFLILVFFLAFVCFFLMFYLNLLLGFANV